MNTGTLVTNIGGKNYYRMPDGTINTVLKADVVQYHVNALKPTQ